jgi:electron transport complex protein RnfB
MAEENPNLSRRSFVTHSLRVLGAAAVVGGVGVVAGRTASARGLWQIDPDKCIQCGKCATNCVLLPSAVRCLHQFGMCGYCDRCFGFFDPTRNVFDTGAENQMCPTDAITRTHIEGPYYEYHILRDKCIGCAKCVKGCTKSGNSSFFLQIDQSICVNCNQCSIAAVCPPQAISRVGDDRVYRIRRKAGA